MKLLFLILFLCNLLSAQVPGYLGKRLNIEMNTFYSPTIFIFDNGNDIKASGVSRFKLNFQVGLNYAFSRKVELGFKYQKGKDFVEYSNGLSTLINGEETEFQFTNEFASQSLNYQYFDVIVNIFTKSYIAPVGWYHGVNFGIIQFNHPLKKVDGGYYYKYTSIYDNTYNFWYYKTEKIPIAVQKKGYYYRLGYAASFKKVITNRLMLNYTFNLNWYINRTKIQAYSTTISVREVEDEILNTVAVKYKRWTDIVLIKLGLSYSLF